MEERVGIECFMNSENTDIRCTLKHRITDFIVEEIAKDGVVCTMNKAYKEGKLNRIGRDQ